MKRKCKGVIVRTKAHAPKVSCGKGRTFIPKGKPYPPSGRGGR